MIALAALMMMLGLQLAAFLVWRASGRAFPEKPPIWFRVASGVAAVAFFASTPLALFFGVCGFFGIGPGGGHSEPTSWEKAFGVIHLLVPLFGLFAVWLALGMPWLRRSSPVGSIGEGYKLLARATRLERRGRVQEALDLYEHIALKYAHTPAGQDAQVSINSLRKQI